MRHFPNTRHDREAWEQLANVTSAGLVEPKGVQAARLSARYSRIINHHTYDAIHTDLYCYTAAQTHVQSSNFKLPFPFTAEGYSLTPAAPHTKGTADTEGITELKHVDVHMSKGASYTDIAGGTESAGDSAKHRTTRVPTPSSKVNKKDRVARTAMRQHRMTRVPNSSSTVNHEHHD